MLAENRSDQSNLGAAAVKVVHIVPGLEPAHGGPSYSVPRICEALVDRGALVTLLSVERSCEHQRDTGAHGYRDSRFPQEYAFIPGIQELRFSSGLKKAIRGAALCVDVIHNHGLWLMPNVYAGQEAARSGKPLIVSPRGMLSSEALAFSYIKKKVFWLLLQKKFLCHAACIHVTSASEYEEVRALGLTNPVAVIPNGVDIPAATIDASRSKSNESILLALGRIHPKKGLDRLLRAWARVEADHPAWRLRIIGPAELGHEKELQALTRSLSLRRVTIEKPIYGDEKLAAYREADLFVLPSLNENFGLTVAESLASGTPVISSKGAPWSGLEAEGCGWWIDHGVEPLAAALANALAVGREPLRAMGARGRSWMERDFSWVRVARDTLELYLWLLSRAEKPSFVRHI